MTDGDLEFPAVPLSPSLPSDFLDPSEGSGVQQNENKSKRSKELRAQMNKWVMRARSKKHDSDKASNERQHRLATVLAIDALVCFMIGFNYEDRSDADKNGTNKQPGRSWRTLVPFLAKLASSAKSVDADLAGVCYQVLAVVRMHVAYHQRRTAPLEDSAKVLYAALADFCTGLRLLPLSIVRERYRLGEKEGWTITKVNRDMPDPVNDTAALPLHVNSTLAECAAFALKIGQKWARLEKIQYDWEAAKY